MKAYELEAVLDGLKNKNIKHFGKPKGRLVRWEIKEKTLKIVTDQTDILILVSDIDQHINDIEVTEDELMVPQPLQTSMISRVNKNLQDILMENINNVKNKKDYLPQAQEINANVKSMIELAKAEIEYMKTLAYFHKKK